MRLFHDRQHPITAFCSDKNFYGRIYKKYHGKFTDLFLSGFGFVVDENKEWQFFNPQICLKFQSAPFSESGT
jgi:hypothetical protein